MISLAGFGVLLSEVADRAGSHDLVARALFAHPAARLATMEAGSRI